MAPAKYTYFQQDWKTNKLYKHWIREDPTSTKKAFCTKCNKSISLSNMGSSALDYHARGGKHINNCKIPNIYLALRANKAPQSPVVDLTEAASTSSKTVASTSSKTEQPLQKRGTAKVVLKVRDNNPREMAQIRWALTAIMTNQSE